MSYIGSMLTPGRIAFAIGTVGVGALIGGAVADHRDGDVATGAVIGGATALAGLALLAGGTAIWKQLTGTHAATAGASQLGANLAHLTVPAPTMPAATLTASATATVTHATPTFATQLAATARELFERAAVAVRPTVPVPAYAATPTLPVAATGAASGSTFLGTLGRFVA